MLVLTGIGIAPLLEIDPSSLEFNIVSVNSETVDSFKVKNNGDAPLLISAIESSSTFLSADIEGPLTIFPDSVQTVQVILNPAQIDQLSSLLADSLTVFSDVGTAFVRVNAKMISSKVEVYNYPNPVRRGESTTFWFVPSYSEVEIKIFNMAGELIRTLANVPDVNTIPWDGTDKDGDEVPPGLYPYVYIYLGDNSVKARQFLQIIK